MRVYEVLPIQFSLEDASEIKVLKRNQIGMISEARKSNFADAKKESSELKMLLLLLLWLCLLMLMLLLLL